jgi:hypothetical protein
MKKTGAGGEIYSHPEVDKLSGQYEIDVVDELSKILSEQIDKEIISSLRLEHKKYRRKNSIKKIYE